MTFHSVAATAWRQPLPSTNTTLILERIQELQQNCQTVADSADQYFIGATGTWCLKDYPATDKEHPVLKEFVLQWEKFKSSPKYAAIAELLPRPAVFHNPPDVPLVRVIAEFITGYALDREKKGALEETNSCDNDDGHGGSDGSCSSSSSSTSSSVLSRNYNKSSHAQNTAIVTLIDVGAGTRSANMVLAYS